VAGEASPATSAFYTGPTRTWTSWSTTRRPAGTSSSDRERAAETGREGRAQNERRPGSPTRLASGTTRSLRCRHRCRCMACGGARRPDSPKGSSLRTRRSSPLISIRTSAAGPPSRQSPPVRAGSR